MDDYNHMMESEQPNLAEMMTGMNSSADIDVVQSPELTSEPKEQPEQPEQPEQQEQQEQREQQEQPEQEPLSEFCTAHETQTDGQSICANADDFSNKKIESDQQLTDECVVDTNDIKIREDTATVTVTNDEPENPSEPDDQNDINESTKNQNEDEFDMNRCRICMSTTNLLDIFRRTGEKISFRICDLIMKLAPSIKISQRDYLPHTVCGNCAERVEAAYELRIQCEETDKFLRSKLKRSRNTRRAPAEFVLIDCAESSSDSNDDQKSDDEFQLSEESDTEYSDTDSESSYDEKKKSAPSRRGGKRRPTPKRPSANVYAPHAAKKQKAASVVYIKAVNSADDESASKKPAVNRPSVKPATKNRLQFRCIVCNRACSTAEALAQHRRMHADEKCNICSAVFKQRSALLQHMQRHREDPERNCQKCHRVFATKNECQRHVHAAHPETVACNKCKRYFPNKQQLDTHKCSNGRNTIETSSKMKADMDTSVSGRDLFKSVAPLNVTTTYWSDSFSD